MSTGHAFGFNISGLMGYFTGVCFLSFLIFIYLVVPGLSCGRLAP